MYSIIFWLLCMLWLAHHQRIRFHPSPSSCYHFIFSPHPAHSGIHYSIPVPMCLIWFVCSFSLLLYSTYEWNHKYLTFPIWFISLHVIFKMFVHIVANDKISPFLWLASISLFIWYFLHSSVDGPFGCFHILAIINNASVNIGVYIFLN